MTSNLAALLTIAGLALAGCAGQPAMPAAEAPAPPAGGPGAVVMQAVPQQPLGAPLTGIGRTWQVRRLTCRQLLVAPDREREAETMFYYGYLAARTGVETIDTGKIDAALRRVTAQCERAPNLPVAEAFQQTLSTPPRWLWQMP